jgi:hypothetical protein
MLTFFKKIKNKNKYKFYPDCGLTRHASPIQSLSGLGHTFSPYWANPRQRQAAGRMEDFQMELSICVLHTLPN